jgi:hypothetical protein
MYLSVERMRKEIKQGNVKTKRRRRKKRKEGQRPANGSVKVNTKRRRMQRERRKKGDRDQQTDVRHTHKSLTGSSEAQYLSDRAVNNSSLAAEFPFHQQAASHRTDVGSGHHLATMVTIGHFYCHKMNRKLKCLSNVSVFGFF